MNVPFSSDPKDSLGAVSRLKNHQAPGVPKSPLLYVTVLANRVSLILLGFSAPKALQDGARVDKSGHQLVGFHHTHVLV